MVKIYIDPRARLVYASYYIQGLYDLFGRTNVFFNIKYFKDLKHNKNSFDQYFAFVLQSNKLLKKVVVDYRDNISIDDTAYSWCDVYGKVNYNLSCSLQYKDKVVSIGPGFGLKIYSFFYTVWYGIINYLYAYGRIEVNYRRFLSGYIWQFKRPLYNEYMACCGDKDYVFFVSSLWLHDNCVINTNVLRASFIRICKKLLGNKFDGGLYSQVKGVEYDKYFDIVYSKYIHPAVYLDKLKKSGVSFNTPAVWDCHGWKLGEYFALGKAIISTPLSNQMPFPLIHGENIHFVNNEEEICDAVKKILEDDSYRRKLELGARDYYDCNISPRAVIERLIL